MQSVTFEGTNGNYRVDYIETIDVDNNKSQFIIDGVYFASTKAEECTFYCDGSVWLGSMEYLVINNNMSGDGVYIPAKNQFCLIPNSRGKKVVYPRNIEGKATTSISLKSRSGSGYNDFNMFCSNGPQDNSEIRQSKSVALQNIPRESTLTVDAGELGSATSLTVNKRNDSFTHTITYECGDMTGTVCTKKQEAIVPFTPPLDLAETNVTGTSVTIYYTINSYYGDTLLGTHNTYAVYSIPVSVKPVLEDGWATVAAYNEDTEAASLNICVQGISKARISFDDSKIDLDSAYGATVVSRKVSYNGISYESIQSTPYTTGVLTVDGTISFDCYVYDTRGRYSVQTVSITVKSYFKPVLSNVQIYRCDADGVEDKAGTYFYVSADFNYAALDGMNYIVPALYYRASNTQTMVQVGYSQAQHIFGGGLMSPNTSYIIRLVFKDRFNNTAQYDQIIASQAVALSIKEGGKGVAFGKYSDEEKVLAIPEDWQIKIGNTYLSEEKLIQLLGLL